VHDTPLLYDIARNHYRILKITFPIGTPKTAMINASTISTDYFHFMSKRSINILL